MNLNLSDNNLTRAPLALSVYFAIAKEVITEIIVLMALESGDL